MNNETQTQTNEQFRYPTFHTECPELSAEEFAVMRMVVCGWMFGCIEVPTA